MTDTAPHALVVGGGVFGVTGALELRRRGWGVTVLDPGPLPHEGASSTDVSKVVRSDYGSDLFYHELGEAAIEGWRWWNREWPRPLYHETGFLILSRGPMAPGGFEHDSYEALVARGRAPTRLRDIDPERLRRWRLDDDSDGYFNPLGGWAESGAVVERLLALAIEAGVQITVGAAAGLIEDSSRVTGVRLADGGRLTADRVVLAAGAWTPSLAPWIADVVWPVGQPVIHFQAPDADAFREQRFTAWAADIANTGWYGFPALPDGRVKVANHGPGERVHPDRRGSVSAEQIEAARAFLRRSLPELADCPVAHTRICMYCDSFDGDFLIAADPDRRGLVLATGGSGHAFKFAPLLGGIIADAVEGSANRWAHRFTWRQRSARRTEEARYASR